MGDRQVLNLSAYNLPPPVGGIYKQAAISERDPIYADDLVNCDALADIIKSRLGSDLYSYNIGTSNYREVQNLFYFPIYGGNRFIAYQSNDGNFFDILGGGASPTNITGSITPLVNSFYSSSTIFVDQLFLAPADYNGGGNQDILALGPTGNVYYPDFVGPYGEDKLLDFVTAYKGRLYFNQTDSLYIWYGDLNQIAGPTPALTSYYIGPFVSRGGTLAILGSLNTTQDISVENLFCAITWQGELLVFQGLYPGDSTWALVGKYNMPPPISQRAVGYYNNSMVVLTKQGLLPLSNVVNNIREGSGGTYKTLTYPINDFLNTELAPDNGFFSSININEAANKLIINYNTTGSAFNNGWRSRQFIMNLQTGAWSRWTALQACQWANIGEELYFGSLLGKVIKANTYGQDYDPIDSNTYPIGSSSEVMDFVKIMLNFNYLGDRIKKKLIRFLRPLIEYSAGSGGLFKFGINEDFNDTGFGSSALNTFTFDPSDVGSGSISPLIESRGYGSNIQLKLQFYPNISGANSPYVKLGPTDFIFEVGGII